MTTTTQDHIMIEDIQDGIVLLKNGSGALVLQVYAVNFGLLSEREQEGIIYVFAQLISSLSFAIQIVVFSTRLNISSYLELLDKARASQKNPLLLKMIGAYRAFILATIKQYEVLDKKFYLVIPLYKDEIGLTYTKEVLWQKVKTVLLPRRDQIMRLLARIGLKTTQLDNRKLIDLFYQIYNEDAYIESAQPPDQAADNQVKNTTPSSKPQDNSTKPDLETPSQVLPANQISPQVQPPANPAISEGTKARNHPFVVEELRDNV